MKIKTKLRILAAMPVALFVITGAVYFVSSYYIDLTNEKALLADDIVKTTSDLTILSYEHNIAHEERPHMQWLAQSATLDAFVKQAAARFTNDDEKDLAEDIRRNFSNALAIFAQIEDELNKAGDSAAERQKEYLARLGSRLLTDLQSIIPLAERLHHIYHDKASRYAQARGLFDLSLAIILAAFVFTVAQRMLKGIAGPITRLEGGMKVFAAGGRETVPVTADDELGALTQHFNVMSQKLWRQAQLDASMAEISRRIVHDKGISIDDISQVILECAQRLTESEFGFAGYIDPETGFLVVPTMSREVWGQCQVASKSIVLEKFGGLWGWVLQHKKPVLANNLAEDPRATGIPAGHVVINRFLSVPAMIGESLVGQLALANAGRDYTDEDLTLVSKIADFYAIALQRLRLEEELDRSYAALERRVEERTAELKITAAELERSNRELQQFAYIASHDLQEPLRKITAFGDRLVMHSAAGLDDKSRDYLARMQSAAGRMKHLIEDLLHYSRVTTQAKPFAALDLAGLLRETLETLEYRIAETGGQVEISGDLPTVNGDRSQLQQLFQNLLGNALKYHQYDLPPRIIVSSQPRADGLAEVVVTDNGIGFDEKYLGRIFLPFQRLHSRQEYEGTGIGLAICQKIVQRHGGTLTARSQPGVGSSFVVTLPISRNEVSHEHTEKTGGDPDCRG